MSSDPGEDVERAAQRLQQEACRITRASEALCVMFDWPRRIAYTLQGPIGNENAVPKVGERFYIHVWTAALDSPFDVITDNYQMKLLLPAGLRADIRTNDDVGCFVSFPNGAFKRYMASNECQDPVKVGVYQQFPAVALGEGETANFWVPVVADRVFTKNPDTDTIGLVSSYSQPSGALPNPLYATNKKLAVDAAPTGTGPTPTARRCP